MENQPSIGDMIRFSWAKSREILFPFDLSRWFKILIIVWLAGAGVQGCSANFRLPVKARTPSSTVHATRPSPMVTSQTTSAVSSSAGAPGTSVSAQAQASVQMPAQGGKKIWPLTPAPASKVNYKKWAVFIVPAVILGLALMFVFMWLTSRFNFILLDVILKKNVAIKEPFREHRELGNSFFEWRLVFIGISLGVFLLIGLIMVALIAAFKGNAVMAGVSGIVGVLLVIAALIAMVFVGSVAGHFVTAIMYREKIPLMDALNRFLDAETFTFGKVFQYILVICGLGILAMIVQSIVGILAGIAGLIAGGIVVVPGLFLIKALPLLKFPLIFLGIFLVVAIIFALIVAVAMVMLPVAIFFRVFALAYLTRLHPDCDLLEFTSPKS